MPGLFQFIGSLLGAGRTEGGEVWQRTSPDQSPPPGAVKISEDTYYIPERPVNPTLDRIFMLGATTEASRERNRQVLGKLIEAVASGRQRKEEVVGTLAGTYGESNVRNIQQSSAESMLAKLAENKVESFVNKLANEFKLENEEQLKDSILQTLLRPGLENEQRRAEIENIFSTIFTREQLNQAQVANLVAETERINQEIKQSAESWGLKLDSLRLDNAIKNLQRERQEIENKLLPDQIRAAINESIARGKYTNAQKDALLKQIEFMKAADPIKLRMLNEDLKSLALKNKLDAATLDYKVRDALTTTLMNEEKLREQKISNRYLPDLLKSRVELYAAQGKLTTEQARRTALEIEQLKETQPYVLAQLAIKTHMLENEGKISDATLQSIIDATVAENQAKAIRNRILATSGGDIERSLKDNENLRQLINYGYLNSLLGNPWVSVGNAIVNPYTGEAISVTPTIGPDKKSIKNVLEITAPQQRRYPFNFSTGRLTTDTTYNPFGFYQSVAPSLLEQRKPSIPTNLPSALASDSLIRTVLNKSPTSSVKQVTTNSPVSTIEGAEQTNVVETPKLQSTTNQPISYYSEPTNTTVSVREQLLPSIPINENNFYGLRSTAVLKETPVNRDIERLFLSSIVDNNLLSYSNQPIAIIRAPYFFENQSIIQTSPSLQLAPSTNIFRLSGSPLYPLRSTAITQDIPTNEYLRNLILRSLIDESILNYNNYPTTSIRLPRW